MAYPNRNRYDNPYPGKNNANSQLREAGAPAPDFPEAYVDCAEKLMKEHYRKITTSKLRNILSLLTDVYNTEMLSTAETIRPDSRVKLQMARIRIAYECGRDRNNREFKEFVDAANLLPWLKAIGNSRMRAIHYFHYLEAIVAYHRFFGGREN